MNYIPSASTRLGCALSMLPRCDTLIDVGCDHGRLCLAWLSAFPDARAVALDISAASLNKARELLEHSGYAADYIEMDGISKLDASAYGAYALSLCGMGGELIARILKDGESVAANARAIVMQPMGGERELRVFLIGNGYSINDEHTVCDAGRYYQLIRAHRSDEDNAYSTSDALLEFGALAYERREAALLALLQKKLASRTRRMERAVRAGSIPASLERELTNVKTLLKGWYEK